MSVPSWLQRTLRLLVAGVSCALAVSGCGGGSGSSPSSALGDLLYVAEFLDAPVVNLQYRAEPSGLSGTTDQQGSFHFASGDTVTFTAAGLAIGSVQPAVSAQGTATITPLTLTGETNVDAAPEALAIARALNTLNLISVQDNAGVAGALVMPNAVIDSNYTALSQQLSALGAADTVSAAQLQTVLTNVYGANAPTVVSDAQAQAALTAAVSASPYANTFWSGPGSDTTGGSFQMYLWLQPDQTLAGATSSATPITGTWVATPGVGYTLTVNDASGGGGSGSGTLASGAHSVTVSGPDGSGGTFSASLSQGSGPGTQYEGIWNLSGTATAAALAAGDQNGTATLVIDPNGNLYGASSDGNSALTGTVNRGTGQATGTLATPDGNLSFTIDFASGTGSASSNGVEFFVISVSRPAS